MSEHVERDILTVLRNISGELRQRTQPVREPIVIYQILILSILILLVLVKIFRWLGQGAAVELRGRGAARNDYMALSEIPL